MTSFPSSFETKLIHCNPDVETPIEEVTNSLNKKFKDFLMTHNLELKMPDMLFDGATFRVSPKSFEGDGALVKLELVPKVPKITERTLEKNTPRILFKKISEYTWPRPK